MEFREAHPPTESPESQALYQCTLNLARYFYTRMLCLAENFEIPSTLAVKLYCPGSIDCFGICRFRDSAFRTITFSRQICSSAHLRA